jgi:hypothetical protein
MSSKVSQFLIVVVSIISSCQKGNMTGLPHIETRDVTSITNSSAKSGGTILFEGDSEIMAKGVCWSKEHEPVLPGPHTSDGLGSSDFISSIVDLESSTEYFVRAYATNNQGTAYGEIKTLRTLSVSSGGQIIADHTIVNRYDDIPQYYIDQVKKMLLVVAGESHALGYMRGMTGLESLNPVYNVSYTATPEAYTTQHLRISKTTWGDVNNETGWLNGYGEEDWYKTALAVSRTKAGISYYASQGIPVSAFGFGWCYDGAERDMGLYLDATQQYIDYCAANAINTKVFFTTGPAERLNAEGETGYYKYLAHEAIRSYVRSNTTRILFDYADILCYDDDGSGPPTATWNGHTFPVITSANSIPEGPGHISPAGELRIAKAMWWMLARMAGWDGS